MPTLTTGQSYNGLIRAGVGTCGATAGVDLYTIPVATSTIVGITTRIVYQRTTNADYGYQVVNSIAQRAGGASVASVTSATAGSVSWAAGATTVTISGAYVKVHATAGWAAVFSAVSEIVELKQPYSVA